MFAVVRNIWAATSRAPAQFDLLREHGACPSVCSHGITAAGIRTDRQMQPHFNLGQLRKVHSNVLNTATKSCDVAGSIDEINGARITFHNISVIATLISLRIGRDDSRVMAGRCREGTKAATGTGDDVSGPTRSA